MSTSKTGKPPKTASKVSDFLRPRDNFLTVNHELNHIQWRGMAMVKRCEGTRKPALEIGLNRQIAGVK